ncbi:hypothetical protein N665_0776s0010 [Sinapis alba]|nr:hypothetical protein N665_0776s0010 [Sinapis alba]
MGSHSLLAELSLFKPLLPIRVTVICKGRTKIGLRFQETQLIFGDEKGNTIHATFSVDSNASNIMPLEEGHSYEITNFKLTRSLELTMLTRNRCHIKLSKSTIILKIEPISNSNFYCFANFITIYHGLAHPKFAIDIYGAVVGVGFLEEYMTEDTEGNNGFIDHKIQFSLVNMDYIHIKCVAYGSIAQEFDDLWNSTDANVVLCVLQFWKIKWGEGLQISEL